ncbi:hypothetical protein EYF80_000807 [Liparis tanakae]|uniref:Uncharacterized protein n=1 Tax=Liparis tanakae TaxID=230148 RepID=A0A4Z2JF98_9TELE|nr:hypothetical protein EYF80_000807 [Liparis tanakae]
MTMCEAPRREQSSEATESSPTPEAPQAVYWQAAVRRQLMKLSIRRYSSSRALKGHIHWADTVGDGPPLAPAHSVGSTQHGRGRAPRITRCLRFEHCNGERSDITGWSVVTPKTHGKKTAVGVPRHTASPPSYPAPLTLPTSPPHSLACQPTSAPCYCWSLSCQKFLFLHIRFHLGKYNRRLANRRRSRLCSEPMGCEPVRQLGEVETLKVEANLQGLTGALHLIGGEEGLEMDEKPSAGDLLQPTAAGFLSLLEVLGVHCAAQQGVKHFVCSNARATTAPLSMLESLLLMVSCPESSCSSPATLKQTFFPFRSPFSPSLSAEM